MFLKKSEKNFLLLSVLVHGIFFGLLIFLNLFSVKYQNKNIFEVTTATIATFGSENKQAGLPQKIQSVSKAQRKANDLKQKDNNNKASEPSGTAKILRAETDSARSSPASESKSESAGNENQLPSLADENAVTEGVRVLNMKEVTSTVKRTEAAVLNHIEGKIRLKILVDESGTVRKITPLNSLGYGLDEVATEAAKKLRFIPARIKTKSVALEAIYTIIFTTNHN